MAVFATYLVLPLTTRIHPANYWLFCNIPPQICCNLQRVREVATSACPQLPAKYSWPFCNVPSMFCNMAVFATYLVLPLTTRIHPANYWLFCNIPPQICCNLQRVREVATSACPQLALSITLASVVSLTTAGAAKTRCNMAWVAMHSMWWRRRVAQGGGMLQRVLQQRGAAWTCCNAARTLSNTARHVPSP
ncbi:hypothetical protein BDN67DRAFT_986120 [Paxillus ammoniavirescens]|nr:hypothetical protein BDN67DRAFT_986120 [Paxillus ammoniavirescens]